MLVRERVARINVCEFCIDIGRYFAIKAGMNEAKFDALEDYATSPLFAEAERAALDYVTELTRDKKVKPETFARLGEALFRAGDLRDCLARGKRALLQHDEHRAEHSIPTCCATSAGRRNDPSLSVEIDHELSPGAPRPLIAHRFRDFDRACTSCR